ncbi:MAG: T9SS type A sorting domain-containing protein, partial [Bacteroidia bacterium]
MRKYFLIFFALLDFTYGMAQNVTWSEDIACIIYSHCSPCHNNEANSAFPLMSYSQVFNQRLAVELYVNTGKMPPAIHNGNYSQFTNERHLTQKQIDLIKVWARDLALEGNPADAPAPPVYGKRVAGISNPDISFITDYQLPDTINDHLRRCFIIKPSLSSVKKIKSIEVIPNNTSLVHAVFVYVDSSRLPVKLDNQDIGKGYSKFYGIGSNTFQPVYSWTLDSDPFRLAKEFNFEIDSGYYFVVQVQYSQDAAGWHDSTLVNIKFDTSLLAARQITTSRILAQDKNIVNWPFLVSVDSTKQFHERFLVENDMTILSISPHAHGYCDNMKVYAILPNKDTSKLLKIDDWDASWSELIYNFKKPVYLPAGSMIHAFSTYSNTVLNQHDPKDELELLHAGIDDHDEEMVFYFSHLPYQTGDESIIFDSTTHYAHHLKCEPVNNVSAISLLPPNSFKVYPNPAKDWITFKSNGFNLPIRVELFNNIGHLRFSQKTNTTKETEMDVSQIDEG